MKLSNLKQAKKIYKACFTASYAFYELIDKAPRKVNMFVKMKLRNRNFRVKETCYHKSTMVYAGGEAVEVLR